MKHLTTFRALLIVTLLLTTAGCFSQKAPSTDAKMDQILSELKEIKELLKDPSKASGSELLLADRQEPALGRPDAPITIVEFTDYQCPYCRKFHDETYPKLKSQYIDTGKARLVIRDLPLSFHENAKPAAVATRCALRQNQFWPVFETLFRAKTLSPAVINQAIQDANLNMAQFDQCRKDPSVMAGINDDLDDAQRLGVDGTPGFVIATRQHGLLSGQLLLGAQPISQFNQVIDPLLAKLKK
jgi:protein-disulfide isomerase